MRIFNVTYNITERNDGKFERSLKDSQNVVAKNAKVAIEKVEKIVEKSKSYWVDDETKSKHEITLTGFDPISVDLEAEA